MSARRNLAAVPLTVSDGPPDLRVVVRDTLAAMDWLAESDEAMRALALRLADQIEQAVEQASELAELCRDLAYDSQASYKRLRALEAACDVTKVVALIAPQLQSVLRDLGGTPAARALMKKDKPVGSRLEQLRSAAGQTD